MFKIYLFLSLALTLSTFTTFAQENQKTIVPSVINGGVINGKAKSLPIPAYPEEAKVAHASGTVKVQVLIDENGDIVSASAIDGHPLLRTAAVEAAKQAKFTPTRLSGQPVKVNGVIVYNFVSNQPNNEEKVKTLGIATSLFLLRGSALNLDKFKQVLDAKDLATKIKEMSDEFPNFSNELAPLGTLEEIPKEKRLDLIDSVIESVRAKTNGSSKWQFELGKNFGDFFVLLSEAVEGDELNFEKFDEANIKLVLAKINDLTYSAPPDFPADVLEKFKQVAALSERKQLSTRENLQELFGKTVGIIETIAPASVK